VSVCVCIYVCYTLSPFYAVLLHLWQRLWPRAVDRVEELRETNAPHATLRYFCLSHKADAAPFL